MTRDPTDITQAVFGPGFDCIRTINEANRIRDERAERLANRVIAGACGLAGAILIAGAVLSLARA